MANFMTSVSFSVELASKLSIISYMNSLMIGNYMFEAHPGKEPAITGELGLIYKGQDRIFKYVLAPTTQEHVLTFECVFFDPKNPPPALLGSNGQALPMKIKKSFPVILGESGGASRLAEELTTWFVKEFKEEVDKE